MVQRVRVVTDSACDLPAEVMRRLSITAVPLTVFFGETGYLDGVEITPDEFYSKLQSSSVIPHTSQPTPNDFSHAYKKLSDAEAIVAILLSSKLSGTYQSAVLGAEMARTEGLKPEITIIDSGLASAVYGIPVMQAAEAASRGADKDEVVSVARDAISRMGVYFVVDTLEYLVKNGRIGRAAGMVGTLLNVKPVLTLDDGLVTPVDKVRGKRKALDRVFELIHERYPTKSPSLFGIVHGNVREEADALAERIRSEFGYTGEIPTYILGGVIGTHVGPGTLAVIFQS